MRILSCYVNGFGRIVNQAFEFSPRTAMKAENGWGKTTLYAFIESMFYGLDSGRSKDIKENDRIKYAPWSGDRFGGSLVFEYRNRRYKVERSFGKTPSADECKIYDENNSENVVLYNEHGEPVEFEQVAVIPYEDVVYVILHPVTKLEGLGEDEGLVFTIVEDEVEGEIMKLVVDEDIIDAVFDIYDRLIE